MSKADYDTLKNTGKLPPTSETFISPTQGLSESYDGVLVKFDMKPGTTDALKKAGVRDQSKIARKQVGELPEVQSGWTSKNAFFKGEGDQVNIGLGRGTALDTFNQNYRQFSGGSPAMTSSDETLIDKLMSGDLSEAEFLDSFPHHVAESGVLPALLLPALLLAAAKAEDGDLVEDLLYVAERFRLVDASYVDVLCTLVVSSWHHKHEDVARLLQELRSPKSVDALCEACELKLSYLEHDGGSAFKRKCVNALAAIGTEKSMRCLLGFVRSGVEPLASFAKKRLPSDG